MDTPVSKFIGGTAATGKLAWGVQLVRVFSKAGNAEPPIYSSIKDRLSDSSFQSSVYGEICKMFRIHHIQERRTSQRFELRWNLSVKGTDEYGKNFNEIGTLANLSSFGAFLYLPRRVRLGEKLELRIKIPVSRDNWMRYTGEVVRLYNVSNSAAVGIKFDSAIPDFAQ